VVILAGVLNQMIIVCRPGQVYVRVRIVLFL
jgi:hypothetical protein